jgi:hypothetical protein
MSEIDAAAVQAEAEALPSVKHVHTAIVNITREMSRVGIGKSKENKEQHFKYRGIDDVLNALSPLYAQYGIFISPNVLERVVVQAKTKSGNDLWKVTVKVAYTVTSAVDGSEHSCAVYGEAMDSADKATNKAMSAAYKYLAIQLFAIPVEGTPDADEHTPEESMVLVNLEQAQEISDLIEATGTDESAFLTFMSEKAGFAIDGVSGIPAAGYPAAIKALKRKQQQPTGAQA